MAQSAREDYLSWDDYFMATAFLARMRSKDPSCQVGACIVNEEKRIVGVGYNGFPNRCPDDKFPWGTSDVPLENKHSYVCHAEMNAIFNKYAADLNGCTLYVTRFPCAECAKMIIQSGIRKVLYLYEKKEKGTCEQWNPTRRMFQEAQVDLVKYVPKKETIIINFPDARLD